MTDDEFLQKLREAFAVEAGEHLTAMTSGLLELEKNRAGEGTKEIVETTFREAHSLKGAARAVNRTDIEMVCQALESVFAIWKKGGVKVAGEAFDVLNAAVDLVERLLALPDVAQNAPEKSAIAEVIRKLDALQSAKPVASRREAIPEPPVPEPVIAPPQPVAQAAPAERLHVAETVRMPLAKLDSLLRQAEELVTLKLAAAQNATELRRAAESFENGRKEWARTHELSEWSRSFEKELRTLAKRAERDTRVVGTMVDSLLDDAKRLVMLPFSTLLDLFPKQVRDLARDQGKEVELLLAGRDVEIDKRILEEMKDPLIHLVRNAIDHGVETPAERAAHGKPARATLTLSVSQLGSKVEIMVADDGCGIDAAQVRASAVKQRILSQEEAGALDDKAALALIFQSGISSSQIITEVSGRGLGMAIVREKTEKLGGQIFTDTAPGKGTAFRILLPVTLATFKGILVRAGGQQFVIPTANVERIERVKRDEIRTVENKETIGVNGRTVALARLAEVLELPRGEQGEQRGLMEVVVLGAGESRIGFAVESVLNEQEVLVKNLAKPLVRVRNVSGATVLGSGTPVLILNVPDLLKSAIRVASSGVARPEEPGAGKPVDRPRKVLVVDDSVTSRMLLKNILETAGYSVATAVDGMDGFNAVKTRDFDVVVSDVEMPRMDGFELTAKIRGDEKLRGLPVVLVTALGSREHQERGVDAGANAYIVKGNFDQNNLLEVIGRLV